MLVGCGYNDEIKYRYTNMLVANLKPLYWTMATLIAGFTPLNYHENSEPDY